MSTYYIVIDKKDIYHSGASLNYIGKKTFGIMKIIEIEAQEAILNKINNIK